MKLFKFFIVLIFYFSIAHGRNTGETEITTEEGIEVFQNEKYYLLKKNVIIESDDFNLSGDIVKIFFEKDLYDIKIIDAQKDVELSSSSYNLNASGDKIIFMIDKEDIFIEGINSKLQTGNTELYSDGEIIVNNITGDFFLSGPNSNMKANDIYIEGRNIKGNFKNSGQTKEIIFLKVVDDEIAFVKTNNTFLYSLF